MSKRTVYLIIPNSAACPREGGDSILPGLTITRAGCGPSPRSLPSKFLIGGRGFDIRFYPPGDVLGRRTPEKPAVLCAELRGARIPHLHTGSNAVHFKGVDLRGRLPSLPFWTFLKSDFLKSTALHLGGEGRGEGPCAAETFDPLRSLRLRVFFLFLFLLSPLAARH